MGVVEQIRSGGWGAILLWIATCVMLLAYWQQAQRWVILMVGSFPVLCLMYIIRVFNSQLTDFWAGGNLKKSAEEIQTVTGKNDFYESAHVEVQERVNELDDKAYGKNVAIISGILLAIIIPTIAFLEYGVQGGVAGLIGSVLLIYLLGTKSVRDLNRLASQIGEVYRSKYEN
jgi:hypothetical protein